MISVSPLASQSRRLLPSCPRGMEFVPECTSLSFPGALVVGARHAVENGARSGYPDGAACSAERLPTRAPGGVRGASTARAATDRSVDGSFASMREASTPDVATTRSRDAA